MARPAQGGRAAACARGGHQRAAGRWGWLRGSRTVGRDPGVRVADGGRTHPDQPAGWEQEVAAFARAPTDGLIVVVSVFAAVQRRRIVQLAAQHRLPAVYFNRSFAEAGGLISYGPRVIDNYRRTASYVDRILKGAKPADLPVQAPTKYELVINLKTAKALGLEIPSSVLARADEVIE